MTAKKTVKKPMKREDKPSFEKSLARLEAIVNEMENGSLSLENMIARFEEGQSLLDFCSKKLNEVERKIEVLVKKGNKVVAEPFGEGDGKRGAGESEEGSELEDLF